MWMRWKRERQIDLVQRDNLSLIYIESEIKCSIISSYKFIAK